MKKIIITIIILIAFCAGLYLAYLKIMDSVYEPMKIDRVLCEIQTGDAGKTIAEKLYRQKIIKNYFVFDFLIRYKKVDTNLKAGYYLFDGELNMLQVIQKIVSGEILVVKVTIPEGFSIYRTFKTISDQGLGDYDTFLDKANNPEFIYKTTGFEVDCLEGFLYPDTYTFGMYMSEENVIGTMVKNFYDKLIDAHLTINDYNEFYNHIILASIVEKEAVFNDEKPMIAGVYLHRLKKGMRLQADPTVTYHLEPEFIHRNRVTYNMTREDTPYNTYVITGLPPKPICSPSVSSIYAVIYPEETTHLFFFADKRGRHIFTNTYEEHLERQRQYRGN